MASLKSLILAVGLSLVAISSANASVECRIHDQKLQRLVIQNDSQEANLTIYYACGLINECPKEYAIHQNEVDQDFQSVQFEKGTVEIFGARLMNGKPTGTLKYGNREYFLFGCKF